MQSSFMTLNVSLIFRMYCKLMNKKKKKCEYDTLFNKHLCTSDIVYMVYIA